jgi:hypothetical protein
MAAAGAKRRAFADISRRSGRELTGAKRRRQTSSSVADAR